MGGTSLTIGKGVAEQDDSDGLLQIDAIKMPMHANGSGCVNRKFSLPTMLRIAAVATRGKNPM